MKSLLLALISLLNFNLFFAQNNIDISNYSFLDSEPSLAVNPANPNNIVAAWMRATSATQITIACSSSSDGGATWTSALLMPHLWPSFTHADVSLDFNATGTAYICYVDYKQNLDSGYVMLSNSTDGGINWNAGHKVTSALESVDRPVDRPWVAVDRTSSAFNGRIYVVSKSMFSVPLPHYVWMKSSSDGGTTWTARKQIDDSIPCKLVSNSMGVPAIGSDGSLYIGYASYNPAQNAFARLICSKSTNGGATFLPHVAGVFAANSAITDTLYQGSYIVSANPTDLNNIIYTCTDARNGDPDILSFHSNDGALTWNTTPIRVNDDAIGNGIGQDMCWAGFSPGGTYVTTWRDRRNGGNTSKSDFELFAAASTDKGLSFSANCKISSAKSPSINLRRGNDFLGVALTNSYIYTDWSDMRTGNTEIFTQKTALTSILSVQGISENKLNLQCYPNPNNGKLNIKLDLPKTARIDIQFFDMRGKLVKSLPSMAGNAGSNDIPLDVSKLPAGQYVLKVMSEEVGSEAIFEKAN